MLNFHLYAFTSIARVRSLFLHGVSLDLRKNSLLGQYLCAFSMEATALLGVGEVFGLDDLGFPILVDKRENEDRIVVDRNVIGGGE